MDGLAIARADDRARVADVADVHDAVADDRDEARRAVLHAERAEAAPGQLHLERGRALLEIGHRAAARDRAELGVHRAHGAHDRLIHRVVYAHAGLDLAHEVLGAVPRRAVAAVAVKDAKAAAHSARVPVERQALGPLAADHVRVLLIEMSQANGYKHTC